MQGPHTFVKICGITRLNDARAAARAGADALGFVFTRSPRRVSPSRARDIVARIHPSVRKIGVFVDSHLDRIKDLVGKVGLDGVQLQGREPPEFLEELREWNHSLFLAKVVRVRSRASLEEASSYEVDAVFFDTKDPRVLDRPRRTIPPEWFDRWPGPPFVLAGGLRPENVGRVVRVAQPWGVDVSGGVEASPGKKDRDEVRRFLRAVRRGEVMVRHPTSG